jgi:hypothetical protein
MFKFVHQVQVGDRIIVRHGKVVTVTSITVNPDGAARIHFNNSDTPHWFEARTATFVDVPDHPL